MMHPEPARIMPIDMPDLMVAALLGRCKTMHRVLQTSALSRAKPGDLLWVRETIRISDLNVFPGRLDFSYPSDGLNRWVPWPKRKAKPLPGIRAPSFMPRELSRLTLRVIHVHGETLQEIEERECYDEGVGSLPHLEASAGFAIRAFSAFWDETHDVGARWADNPEVCAIRFAVIRQRIDALVPGLGHGGVR